MGPVFTIGSWQWPFGSAWVARPIRCFTQAGLGQRAVRVEGDRLAGGADLAGLLPVAAGSSCPTSRA